MDIGIRTRARTVLARFESTPAPAPAATAGSKGILYITAGVVFAVAGFAATQSYSHIYWLGHTHRQDQLDSALLPLSVDGLITAASLVLLYASRAGRPAPLLARVALWLSIAVTVAANVAFGIPAGIVGALVSAWPAFAFVLAVELLMRLVRLVRTNALPERAFAVPAGALPAAAVAPPAAASVCAPQTQGSAHQGQRETHLPAAHPVRTRKPVQTRPGSASTEPVAATPEAVSAHFGDTVPSQRQVMAACRISRPKAVELLAALPGSPELVDAVNGTPVEGSQA